MRRSAQRFLFVNSKVVRDREDEDFEAEAEAEADMCMSEDDQR